jgi:hypothetical protein
LRNWRNLLEGEKLETNSLHGPRMGAVDRRDERAFGLLRPRPEALKPPSEKGVIIPQNGLVRAGAGPEVGRHGDVHGRGRFPKKVGTTGQNSPVRPMAGRPHSLRLGWPASRAAQAPQGLPIGRVHGPNEIRRTLRSHSPAGLGSYRRSYQQRLRPVTTIS